MECQKIFRWSFPISNINRFCLLNGWKVYPEVYLEKCKHIGDGLEISSDDSDDSDAQYTTIVLLNHKKMSLISLRLLLLM